MIPMMRMFVTAFAAAAFTAVTAGTAAAQQTYLLKCRSGATTAFNISVEGDLRFGFTKAANAAGDDGASLSQGECAWVDRPVSDTEPGTFAAALGPNFKVGAVVPNQLNGSFKAYIYAATQAWVYNFQTQDVILTIGVYNDGQYLRAPNP